MNEFNANQDKIPDVKLEAKTYYFSDDENDYFFKKDVLAVVTNSIDAYKFLSKKLDSKGIKEAYIASFVSKSPENINNRLLLYELPQTQKGEKIIELIDAALNGDTKQTKCYVKPKRIQ